MKYALIIGNNKYDDQKLAQLKTPAADSQALAKILDDKTIGSVGIRVNSYDVLKAFLAVSVPVTVPAAISFFLNN
jgi:hypothetical protein